MITDPPREPRPSEDESFGGSDPPENYPLEELRPHLESPSQETSQSQDPSGSELEISGSEPSIEIENLTAHYGSREVLSGIDLRIRREEILVIVGGSGCGKSTLLRHIIGLQQPTTGSIKIAGEEISRMSEADFTRFAPKIGVLFQSGALFNALTVGENVALPLRQHTELDDDTIQLQVRLKLGLVGLADSANKLPGEISGGMKKRAAIARAIALDPEIIFFDELSAGLDPSIAADLDHLILRLRRLLNMTMVVVSHEVSSIFTIADRIALLSEGRIAALGTREEMLSSSQPDVVKFFRRKAEEETTGSVWLSEILDPESGSD